MRMSSARNGADSMDGALAKFSSAKDFEGFSLSGLSWDDGRECLRFTGASGTGVLESPGIDVDGGFDQLIMSWNAHTPEGSCLTLYAQARMGGEWTKWYTLGIWSTGGCPQARTCVKGQKDDQGDVDTDTLKLVKLCEAFRVKVEFASANGSNYPCLRFLSVNVIDSSLHSVDIPPLRDVWGRELDVPYFCQISVEGGGGWCSATSVTMLLNYWSGKLNRPELAVGITESARAIYDEAWKGTGNWPFNTAHAAEFGGIRAYVTRFVSVSQIERWIDKGVPVVVSLHSSKLRREERDNDPGHLMVIRGFTSEGDPIFNDPWPRGGDAKAPPREYPVEDLRKVYPREDLEYAWLGPGGSWGTVYLIYPESK